MAKIVGGMIGEILEQGGSIVAQTAKTIKQIPGDVKNSTKSQAGLAAQNGNAEAPKTSNEEIVKSSYKTSDSSDASQGQPNQAPQAVSEDQQLAQTRNELQQKKQAHQQQHDIIYYNPTFNPPQKQEERPAEKVEREKQQEMQELQQEEAEKPDPLAVKRAQNIEKFRGASG